MPSRSVYPYPSSSDDDDKGPYTIAELPLSGTTVTATAVPSTTGLAVVDGTTISFRADGITLSDGQVFSLGFNGLVASSTTGTYRAVSTLHNATPSVKYDETRHPTSAITLTNSDESTWVVDVSPTETTTESEGVSSTSLISSGQQVSTLMSASATGTGTESTITGTSGTSQVTTGTETAVSTTTGGSSAVRQQEVSIMGTLVVVLLGMLGFLRL